MQHCFRETSVRLTFKSSVDLILNFTVHYCCPFPVPYSDLAEKKVVLFTFVKMKYKHIASAFSPSFGEVKQPLTDTFASKLSWERALVKFELNCLAQR